MGRHGGPAGNGAVPPPPPGGGAYAPAPGGEAYPPAPGGGTATATLERPPQIEVMDAFVDQPPQRIDVAKLAPFGWGPAIVLALVGFIDKAENSVLGGVLTELKNEFGFKDSLAGLLFSAPTLISCALLIPAGILADKYKRKDILVVVIVVWSILSFGTAAAPGLVVFFIFRLAIGAAAPLNVPATASLIGDFYPLRARTRAFSIVRAVENAGLPAGVLIGGVVGENIGWRAAFVVVGVPGLILAFVLFKMVQEPRRGIGDDIAALAGDRATLEFAEVPGAQVTTTAYEAPDLTGPHPPYGQPGYPPPPPGWVPPPPAAYGQPAYGEPGMPPAPPGWQPQPQQPTYGMPGMPPPPPGWQPGMPVFGMPGAPATYGQTAPVAPGHAANGGAPQPPGRQWVDPNKVDEYSLRGRAQDVLAKLRQLFLIPTVRKVVLGEAILFASFAGIFAFTTDFIAETYFDNPLTKDDTEGSSKASILVAGVSIPFIALGATIGSYIDKTYAKQKPSLRIDVSIIAIGVGIVAIIGYVLSDPIQLRLAFFYLFAGVNIIAVANLAAACADSIPARIRGSGFAILQVCLAAGGTFGPIVIGLGSSLGGEDKRWGFAALIFPLAVGAYVVNRARLTYPPDAAQVVTEAAGGPARVDPLAGSETNQNAVKAFWAGLLCIPLVPLAPVIGAIGLTFGIRALREIKNRPMYGRGLALIGVYLSSLLGGVILLILILRIASGDAGPPED